MAQEDLPFENIRQSALKRLRLGEAPAAAQRQQAINVSGLRTSGVGQLPLIEAARNRSLGEAGIEQAIAGQQVQQLGAERLARLQGELEMQRLRALGDIQGNLEATAGRRSFQSGLISGGLGAIGGGLKTALTPLLANLLTKKKAPVVE